MLFRFKHWLLLTATRIADFRQCHQGRRVAEARPNAQRDASL